MEKIGNMQEPDVLEMRKKEERLNKREGDIVNYPKELMRKKELMKMGIPEAYIDRAIAEPGQLFAFKINPLKKNSPYLINTSGFEEWRKKDEELQAKTRKLQMQVM